MRKVFATLAVEAQLDRIADALERAHPDVRPDPVVLPYRMRGRAFPVNQEGLDQLCANIDELEAALRELGVPVSE